MYCTNIRRKLFGRQFSFQTLLIPRSRVYTEKVGIWNYAVFLFEVISKDKFVEDRVLYGHYRTQGVSLFRHQFWFKTLSNLGLFREN